MKKIFTFIAAVLMAVCAQADNTLVEYNSDATLPAGVAINGTTAQASVKIHTNKDAVNCIQLKNGYITENALNGNNIELSYDGGFKSGDIVTFSGFFNNSDDTKNSAIDIYVKDNSEAGYTLLYTSAKFVNGRLSADDPVKESYTLTADADKLYFGRNGNTGTNLYTIKVVRPGGSVDPTPEPAVSAEWNFTNWEADATGITSGTTIKDNLGIAAANPEASALGNGIGIIDASKKTIDDVKYTQRFKMNGAGYASGLTEAPAMPSQRFLYFAVKGNSEVYIAAATSSSGNTRYVYLSDGTNIIGSVECANATDSKTISYTGGATTLYIYCSGGCNIYDIKATNVGTTTEYDWGTTTAVNNIAASAKTSAPAKRIMNGQIVIEKDGNLYNVAGQLVK